MEHMSKQEEELFHLARVAFTGRVQDVALLVRKYARRYRDSSPEFAKSLTDLLRKNPTRSDPTRRVETSGLPLDGDSRLPLIRVNEVPVLEMEPVYDTRTWSALRQVVRERKQIDKLAEAGVDPTRTMLFTGPPGVGKTLAAKWIAREIGKPLAVLDLSSVMSSFLGRTGNNIRAVLDYAKDHDCVLLLDELDAVAKRRNDTGEIGELKRLVNVILQEIDEWPPSGLLLAATNHADLLDSAVWRRFELVTEFPLPQADGLEAVLKNHLELDSDSSWPAVLSSALVGSSHSDAYQLACQARRVAVLEEADLEIGLQQTMGNIVADLSRAGRQKFAISLVEGNLLSQRQSSELTGVSRDTIRKHIHSPGGN